jgi:hypothetical protein
MGQKAMMGGFALATVKKLKGDRFRTPSALMVLTKAMGRGRMEPLKRR